MLQILEGQYVCVFIPLYLCYICACLCIPAFNCSLCLILAKINTDSWYCPRPLLASKDIYLLNMYTYTVVAKYDPTMPTRPPCSSHVHYSRGGIYLFQSSWVGTQVRTYLPVILPAQFQILDSTHIRTRDETADQIGAEPRLRDPSVQMNYYLYTRFSIFPLCPASPASL